MLSIFAEARSSQQDGFELFFFLQPKVWSLLNNKKKKNNNKMVGQSRVYLQCMEIVRFSSKTNNKLRKHIKRIVCLTYS